MTSPIRIPEEWEIYIMRHEHFREFEYLKVECNNTDELIGLIDEAVKHLEWIHNHFVLLRENPFSVTYHPHAPSLKVPLYPILLENFIGKLLIPKCNKFVAKAKEFCKDKKAITSTRTLGNNADPIDEQILDGVLFVGTVKIRLERIKAILQGNKEIRSVDKDSDGCYIATATIGDRDHPDLILLRKFRDQYLLNNLMSVRIVQFYYKISPPLARKLEQYPALRLVSRAFLVHPAVWFASMMLRKGKSYDRGSNMTSPNPLNLDSGSPLPDRPPPEPEYIRIIKGLFSLALIIGFVFAMYKLYEWVF